MEAAGLKGCGTPTGIIPGAEPLLIISPSECSSVSGWRRKEGRGHLKEANTVAQQQHHPWGWIRQRHPSFLLCGQEPQSQADLEKFQISSFRCFQTGQQVEVEEAREKAKKE